MNAIDNVQLSKVPTMKQWLALERLKRLAASPDRNAPWHSVSGNWTKNTGKLNNRGRYTWVAQLGPVPPAWELLDYLPPGARKACWRLESNGEYRLWIAFTVLVHHSSLRKLLSKEGLNVLYLNGCTYRELQANYDVTAYNKLSYD